MTKKQYNAYNNMSIEQLHGLLRGFFDVEDPFPDHSLSENSLSTEELEAIAAALEQKETSCRPETTFREILSGFAEAPFALDMEPAQEEELLQKFLPKRRQGKKRSFMRSFSTAAAVLLFAAVFSAVGISAATGHGLFAWLENALNITFGDGYVDSPALAEAITAYGTDCKTVPARTPEGFELTTMDVLPEPGKITYFAEYTCDDRAYSITAVQYTEGTIPPAEIITTPEVCSSRGINYYFDTVASNHAANGAFSDTDGASYNRCCWTEGSIVFTLQGTLSRKEIRELLNIPVS